MFKLLTVLNQAVKNKVLQYLLSRYVTYIIQFFNSILIAIYLGPYYLGVWGFISLIIQYLDQINLGIPHAANSMIAINKNRQWYIEKTIGTSITMLTLLSAVVVIFFTADVFLNFGIGDKFNFSQYTLLVVLIGILAYFNSLFSHVFRVYGRITEIAISQSALPVIMLLAVIIFKEKNLLWALIVAYLLSFLLTIIIYTLRSPVRIRPVFIMRLAKTIQVRGWHLFVYNASFYLIIISTKSFISGYYTVEEFGIFTFAFALANAILLLLQSFSFLIYPKLLNRMASALNGKVASLLNDLRDIYVTTSHLLIHLAILIFPLFLLLFPKYDQAGRAFNLAALTVVLYTNSFGYSGLFV
ncbi:MAG TPA: oligosaccharide flippase family protein, partial [Bacteroidales bacterium]|nr:oligosaccharide flippase family protein [Bacteroidales bacterium]